jgi:hypothetical protein
MCKKIECTKNITLREILFIVNNFNKLFEELLIQKSKLFYFKQISSKKDHRINYLE